MPGQPVRIGPFVGGMNTYSGPSAISDDEAVELRNLDVDLDGSLVSRSFIVTSSTAPKSTVSRVIGTYSANDGSTYLIFAFSGGGVYALKTGAFTWTTIDSTGEYTSCVQYNSKLWLVKKPAGAATGGSQWDPTGGLVAVANMPRGVSCVIYKERMFVASSVNNDDTSMNRLKFSNAANPGTWTSTDTLDVRAGDGQDITALWVFDNNIVVFKTNSTYVYSYESQPAKGQVQIVNGAIGCANSASVCEYENSLFIMHKANVYRISNWIWEQANVKVPFKYANSNSLVEPFTSAVSVLGNRIICRYYDNYYVLGTKTGAWTIWDWGTSEYTYYGTRTNYFVNPSGEAGITEWIAGLSREDITSVADVTAPSGTKILRATANQVTTGFKSYVYDIVSGWSANDPTSMAVWVRPQINGTYRLTFSFRTGATEILQVNGPQVPVQAGVWTYLKYENKIAPAGTDTVYAYLYKVEGMAIGEYFDWDAALLEKNFVVGNYIEGTVNNTPVRTHGQLYPSVFVRDPFVDAASGYETYYAGNVDAGLSYWFRYTDGLQATNSFEKFTARLITKAYDFGVPYGFKRLYWWGVDLLGKTFTSFKVTPNAYSTQVTWGDLSAVPFSQYQTWGRPLDVSLDVTDSISGANPAYYRTFIKLLKGLRFRQAQFTLETTTDGSGDTGPFRVFSLTSYVDNKETVVKKVS